MGFLGFGQQDNEYGTPTPGDQYLPAAQRGQQIMAQAFSQMFGSKKSAFGTGPGGNGNLAGNVFGGGGEGGGFGGLLGQMMGQLGGGYDQAIGSIGQSEKYQRGEAKESGKQNLANMSQTMSKSGLNNSTVMASMSRGLNYDTQKTLQGISTQAEQLKSQLSVGKGHALAGGTQFGIGAQQDAMMKMLALFTGTAGLGPSGWNTLTGSGGPVVNTGSSSITGGIGA